LWDTLWLVLVLVLVLLAVAVFMLLWAKIHEAVDRIRSKFSAVVPLFFFFYPATEECRLGRLLLSGFSSFKEGWRCWSSSSIPVRRFRR